METGAPAARSKDCAAVGVGRPNVLIDEFLAEPARQGRSSGVREALLESALVRFAANGYDATTVEEIARHAGIAVGGFYLQFRSKRQVLLVLVDRLLCELDSIPANARADDAASIIECIRWCFCSLWQHAGVYRAWREATLREASLAEIQDRIEAWTTMRIAAALNAAAATPGARLDADVPALSTMLSVIFLRLLESEMPDRTALSETVVALVRHALFGPRAPESDEAARAVSRAE